MSHLFGQRVIALYLVGVSVAAIVGVSSALLPIQFVILILAALGVTLLRPAQMLFGSVLLVAVIGLIRRVLAAPHGRIYNDPLALLPVMFVIAALVFSSRGEMIRRGPDAVSVSLFILALAPWVATLVEGRLGVETLFIVVLQSTVWLLVANVRNGRVPDVWPRVVTCLPVAGIALALYGLGQFLILPEWDRAWMVASGLQSIGHATAGEVRVFGTAESPGPFAAFLGVCAVVAGAKLVDAARGELYSCSHRLG